MAEANPEGDLNDSHYVFATEVIRALNRFCSIPVDLQPISDEDICLTDGIYWGIITVSYLFRKKNYQTFFSMKNSLQNENFFQECCMFIPTEKNVRFFFNFLKRVSKIYEMAVFCYKNNHNYFATARNCIAQFQEKEFFESYGSWQRLDRIGSFLCLWGKRIRPLMIREIHKTPGSTSNEESVKTVQIQHDESLIKESINKEKFESKVTEEESSGDLSCPYEREKELDSSLLLLLEDEITEDSQLGCIESEIKSVILLITKILPPEKPKCKELQEAEQEKKIKAEQEKMKRRKKHSSVEDDCKAESSNPQKLSEMDGLSKIKDKIAKFEDEISKTSYEVLDSKTSYEALDSFREEIMGDLVSSLKEKWVMKQKYQELVHEIIENEDLYRQSSGSNEKEKNETGNSTILEEDLYLSSSSNDGNLEQPTRDKDCNENDERIGSQNSCKTISASNSNFAEAAKSTDDSHVYDNFIKTLVNDYYVKATLGCISSDNSGSQGTELYHATDSPDDEVDPDLSENNESVTMIVKSENKSEVKSSDRPLAIPSGSSGSAIAKSTDPILSYDDFVKAVVQHFYVTGAELENTSSSDDSSGSQGTELYHTTDSPADEDPDSIPNFYLWESSESENESELKSSGRPLAIPSGSSASAVAKDSSNETNKGKKLSATKSEQSSSSEADENPNRTSNANNAKPQQRKTKRRKKKNRSKK